MRRWLSLLTLGLMSIPLVLWWQGMPLNAIGQEELPAPRRAPDSPQYRGAGSCAAAACHNSHIVNANAASEFAIWSSQDRHAKAYEVLFEERSTLIQKHLRSKAPAHEEQRCLNCHVTPNLDPSFISEARYFKTDGVSCESCHGPAGKWLGVHHLPAWQKLSSDAKKIQGMSDTQSLVGRAQVCVRCHVGEAGMDVDHDLIAAGHPRLHFEFTAFHAFMPRHWPDAKDRDPLASSRGRRDFEARAWVVGKMATARAALELLADRAADSKKPWPEFAEHDCAACHQDLQASRKSKERGPRKLGTMPWGHHVNLTPEILAILGDRDNAAKIKTTLTDLQDAMTKAIKPNRDNVARDAKSAALLLNSLLDQLDHRLPDVLDVNQLLEAVLGKEGRAYADQATQIDLGAAALYRAHRDLKRTLPAKLYDSLLQRKMDNPKSYDPEAIRRRLGEFKNLDIKKDP